MATFIFSGLGARGHLHTPVAVAKVLRERGHTVALYTASDYRYIAERLDLVFLPPKKWLDFDFTFLERYWPELTQFEGASRSMQIYFKIFMGTALDQAQDLAVYYDQLKPDVLVTEPHAFGTQIVALKLGVPWAVIGIALGTLSLPILGQHGIPLANKPYIYLCLGVPAFDRDKPNVLPQTHYVGGFVWDEGNTGNYTNFELPLTSLPLVFVSQGTMFAREDFFKKVVEASRNQPWHSLISTSRKIDPKNLQPLPDNVTALTYAPYSLVWPKIAMQITHGSAASTLGAFNFGLPQIVTPLEADHLANANILTKTGTALRLSVETSTVEEIREAIREVLYNPTYRSQAQALQARLKTLGGAERAADLLEELAYRKSPILAETGVSTRD